MLTAYVLDRDADFGGGNSRPRRTGTIVQIRGYVGRDGVVVYDGKSKFTMPGTRLELRP